MRYAKIGYILFILFIGVNTKSQTAEKGFQMLAQEKFPQAIDIFNKSVEKNKELIESKFGLALAYSNTAYSKYRYDRAYRNLLYVEKRYEKLTGSEKALLRKNFNIDDISIGKLKLKILDEVFEEAKMQGTIEKLTIFCENFPNTEQSREGRLLITRLAFKEAISKNDPIQINDFIRKHQGTPEADSAYKIIEQIEKEAYERYSAEGELESLLEFGKLYPNYSDKERLFHDIALAEYAVGLEMDAPYNQFMEKSYLEYMDKAAPLELAFVALIRTISPYLAAKNWNKAIEQLQKYKSLFPGDSRIDKICEILSAPDKSISLESISETVNTSGHEYAPVLTADGKTLYFCGRGRTGNIGGEDIFVSKFKEGNWTKPELLSSINTPYAHEAPLAISADGSRLLLYANTDIYYSDKTASGWTIPRQFPSINKPDSWEADAFMTADGNAILFISDRKGNIGNFHKFGDPFHGSHSGNSDIYVSAKTESGWSAPINLGKTINTPYSERSPFLHPDMKTLYFSSEGHPGLGRLDVFKSVRLTDTSWTLWSEPVNLGKELNSHGDDYDYKISTDGKTAYLSSYRSGNYDILKLEIPETIRPDYVATVWGFITNRQGGPVQTNIKWEDLNDGKTIGLLQSDIIEGSYMIILPLGRNYGYFIDDPNYYPLSGNIDLTGKNEQITIRKDFILFSNVEIINEGVSVPLENVFFEFNKFNLKKESFSELNRLVAFLEKNANLKVEIAGHTDNIGSDEHNKKLSDQRANSVKEYLLRKGISSERLQAIGYGPDKPVADNKTEAGRAKNRRVEFKVVVR